MFGRCRIVWGLECSVELHAGANVEFAVDAAEVDFNGLGADEQCGGDVSVGHSCHGQLGDALFGWRQSLGSASSKRPRPISASAASGMNEAEMISVASGKICVRGNSGSSVSTAAL